MKMELGEKINDEKMKTLVFHFSFGTHVHLITLAILHSTPNIHPNPPTLNLKRPNYYPFLMPLLPTSSSPLLIHCFKTNKMKINKLMNFACITLPIATCCLPQHPHHPHCYPYCSCLVKPLKKR